LESQTPAGIGRKKPLRAPTIGRLESIKPPRRIFSLRELTQPGLRSGKTRPLKKALDVSLRVFIAGPDYEKGFARFHAAIERVDLGPRFPKRDPRNLERVKRIVDALVAEKIGT